MSTYEMQDLSDIAIAGGGLVLAAFGWLLKREVGRIDVHGEKIEDLERGSVSKVDLDRTETRILSAISEARTQINATNARIDRLKDG